MARAKTYTQDDLDLAVALAVAAERNRAQRLADDLRNEANAARTEKQTLSLKNSEEVARFHRLDGIADAHQWAVAKVLELTGAEFSDAELAAVKTDV